MFKMWKSTKLFFTTGGRQSVNFNFESGWKLPNFSN